MAAQAGSIEYVGRIMLDASELARMFGMSPSGAVTGVGGVSSGSPSSDEQQAKVILRGMRKSYKDPSFMSIFRPLAALEGLKGLIANSRVANTYLGAMGKMFSAAIDLLLLPFTPIFNLMLLGLAKLIAWLIDSGYLEWMAKGVDDMLGVLKDIWNFLKPIGEAIGDLARKIWELLPEDVRDGLRAIGRVAAKMGGVLAAVGGAALLTQMGMGAIGLGAIGPVAIGGKILGKVFGGGGGAAVTGGAVGAESAAGSAAGASMMARMGLTGGRGFFGMNSALQGGLMAGGGLLMGNTLGQQRGSMGAMGRIGGAGLLGAGIGTMILPGWGTAIGGGVGLGVGGLAELGVGPAKGLMGALGMGKPGQGGGGGNVMSGGKVVNIGTQNVTMHIKVEDPKRVKQIMDDVDERTINKSEG